MAAINITQADYDAVAGAAIDAFVRHNTQEANALDKVARKMNAALANAAQPTASMFRNGTETKLSWKDTPSTFEHLTRKGA